MIVAERKPFDEIKEMVKSYDRVLTVGCATCVAVCLAGGSKEVGVLNTELKMARKLEGKPLEMAEHTIERQCDREFLAELDDLVPQYDAVVSMACGVGVQFMAERFADKPVLPAVDTAFMGVNQDVGWYEERCRGCGTCFLAMTGGICPITMCSKSLLNGPCGGTNQGKCEVSQDQDCAWYQIHERLAKQNRLANILTITPPTMWRNTTPRTIIQPGYEKRTESQT